MEEQMIGQQDSIFRWEGPKRKATLFSAKLGRLVLTSQRIVFLSSGKNDLSAGKLMAAAVAPIAGQMTGSTTGLDETAAENPGSIEIPLGAVTSTELKGMFKVLTIGYTDDSGAATYSTFAPKNGGMPAGQSWIESIDQARAGLGAADA